MALYITNNFPKYGQDPATNNTNMNAKSLNVINKNFGDQPAQQVKKASSNKNKKDKWKSEIDTDKPRLVDSTSIYIVSRKINALNAEIAAKMPAGYKYSVGKMLLEYGIQLSIEIVSAYKEKENLKVKLSYMDSVIEATNRLLTMLQVANDVCIVSRNLYALQVENCVAVIKQAAGWMNSIKRALESGEVAEAKK